jgi:hypothetical protein
MKKYLSFGDHFIKQEENGFGGVLKLQQKQLSFTV